MKDSDYLIDCETLHAGLGAADLCVVDCRFDLAAPGAGHSWYLEGHIPGSVFADLDKDLAAPVTEGTGRHPMPDPDAFAASMSRLGIGKDTQVVCYDQASGALAARLWWLLRWAGHDTVRLLNGGWSRWCEIGLPVESGAVDRAPAEFRVTARDHLIASTDEIVARGAATMRLVDARDAARYAGDIEPIDNVAGHIPGALNVPFAESLEEDGAWKDLDQIRNIWEEALEADYGKEWAVMCGSGVTACHLVVSGLLAGLPEPRVYVGSWSEWITDPERPVEKGE